MKLEKMVIVFRKMYRELITVVKTAFTSRERSTILIKGVVNKDNINNDMESENNTNDKIFFLSRKYLIPQRHSLMDL